jgi:transaldolase
MRSSPGLSGFAAERNLQMIRPKTNILVDGGDSAETARVKQLLGFVDGQTTNPTLISKNPHIKQLLDSGHRLSQKEELNEYKEIVEAISPLVGDGGVSIEVFADHTTTAQAMLDQAREMFSWIPNAYIKFPCTREGLQAAETAVKRGIRVNMTLCFSQQQVAAVYAATKATKIPVYVSPFVGRLDDIGQNGMDLIKNAKRMLAKGDGHVQVLAASIRNLEQLLYCFFLEADLVTVPAKVLEKWAEAKFPMPSNDFVYKSTGQPIPYQELSLDQPWPSYELRHELTDKGLQKFAEDYRKTITSGG